jgi:hypothetical protein
VLTPDERRALVNKPFPAFDTAGLPDTVRARLIGNNIVNHTTSYPWAGTIVAQRTLFSVIVKEPVE